MNTYSDVWNYLCNKGFGRSCSQFYVKNPNETAKGFWNGILTALEAAGTIDAETSYKIWVEITGEG